MWDLNVTTLWYTLGTSIMFASIRGESFTHKYAPLQWHTHVHTHTLSLSHTHTHTHIHTLSHPTHRSTPSFINVVRLCKDVIEASLRKEVELASAISAITPKEIAR